MTSSFMLVSVPEPLSRMIYMDDSGDPKRGTAVFGWVEFAPHEWAKVLEAWLNLRRKLWNVYGIPAHEELHTTTYVGGRGRIARTPPERLTRDGQTMWKDLGREVAEEALRALAGIGGLRVGAVFQHGPSDTFEAVKKTVYRRFIDRLEGELRLSRSLAMLFMDGDGSDSTFRDVHRGLNLRNRRVIEDAIHLDSRASQFIQMADLVAWCAHVHVELHEKSRFAWNWYADYLSLRDPLREPQSI